MCIYLNLMILIKIIRGFIRAVYLNPEKKQHNVILLQKATISLKNAVIGCSTTMKIRIFHTAHYETRITENESYQTLVAIFDHRR
ncbi:hypothetical protein FCX71_24600 [Escherichia coli]|nr:hypothetical protein [Escherichia coli]